MKLLLVDAMNLIRRVYAAVAERPLSLEATSSRSLAIIGHACEQLQCSHVAVIFEEHVPTWRHEIWPDYKKGRPPMPEELHVGLGEIRQALRNAGLPCLELTPWEADDVIASIANKAVFAGVAVAILSTDKGFCQLVNGRLQVCNHFDRVVVDESVVYQKFGLLPSQLVDFWAMTGDSTNHIPGVPGIGPKAAASLLDRFGSLDRILVALDQVDGRAGQALREHWQQALLSRELARLRTDLSTGVSLNELRWRLN